MIAANNYKKINTSSSKTSSNGSKTIWSLRKDIVI